MTLRLTCAAVLAAHRLVRLLEAAEQLGLGAGIDANASVSHTDVDALRTQTGTGFDEGPLGGLH